MIVIADTCLCEYTDHGHCGVVKDGVILNDESLELLAQTAVSQAKAGADIIAPSNMMDGFVTVIREALDKEGFTNVPIMSYAVKYSSEFTVRSATRLTARRSSVTENISDGSGQPPGSAT